MEYVGRFDFSNAQAGRNILAEEARRAFATSIIG
jgi:hypothetical protein